MVLTCLLAATFHGSDLSQAAMKRAAECMANNNINPDSERALKFFIFLPLSDCYDLEMIEDDGDNYRDAMMPSSDKYMQVTGS